MLENLKIAFSIFHPKNFEPSEIVNGNASKCIELMTEIVSFFGHYEF
jgi:hypothetical protein